ncbi:PKHD-type hydroxylase [Pseudomonas peli]|uniref:PKHD-type hydroxylase n=1 Tax=Pseudomonas peli TaxID=592361 RepID=A0AB37Z4R9_9PSED|nr:Fe2+-dependent dioxygenase [Pseudomonas peli]NMZ68565.1 Fe2+-dependent dioxygenase [Pseudomonas peli]SCW43046.1 PKHD-type hydroxylase [Pseudomonas peli]|tara:strand:+ start:5326 stop:6006 length:681 start_codon:yes stop_codon:yes gene_type:complete
MMLSIADVLTPEQVRECRQAFEQASWQDGRLTAGYQAAKAKANQQLAQDDPLVVQIGDFIVQRLGNHPQFVSAALPLKVLPPRFNRYTGGGTYGNHIDNAIFSVPGTPHRVRSDLSATLFFSDPDEYEGGELVVEDSYGSHSVKLPAGHLVLYPGSSLHRVNPVTRGTRYAAFFWIQSLVRDDTQRGLLLELDRAVQALTLEVPESAELARLTGVYHNLLRQWANT